MSNRDTSATASSRQNPFLEHVMWVLLGLFVIWGVFVLETYLGVSWSHRGLYPRSIEGLWGVVTMPFLHGDLEHLMNNSFGLLILGLLSFQYFERETPWVVLAITLGGGLLVWFFARPVYHIGSSGIVYGLSAFLFFSGIFNRTRQFKGAALIVAMLYGSSVWGLLPIYVGVSWEGHLFGALVGVYMAALFRRVPDVPVEDDEDAPPHWHPDQTWVSEPEGIVVPLRRLSHKPPPRPFTSSTVPRRRARVEADELDRLLQAMPRPLPLKPKTASGDEPSKGEDPSRR